MPIKNYRPVTPSRRHMTGADFSDLTRRQPEKALCRGKRGTGGRNHHGHVTTRFRGGGHRRKLRQVDFKRDKVDIPARVAEIEYDPNRSARLALLHYVDGEKRYILCPVGVTKGMTVMSGRKAEPKPGNALPLSDIPDGMAIHCLELQPGGGGVLVRAAGQQAILRGKEGGFAQVKLPSGEVRRFNLKCLATVGQVGNTDHMNVAYGKAGKTRYRGRRPHVRGVAMNPVDHPMGGGEGRTSGGGHPQSPWSQLAKGKKTRHRKNPSSRFIIERRKK